MEFKCKQDNIGARCAGKSTLSTPGYGLVVILIWFEGGILSTVEGTGDMDGGLDELSSRRR